jgi:hypothetical protein
VTDADLRVIMANEVIKRDALDGEGATSAKSVLKKAESIQRRRAAKTAKSAMPH